MTVSRWATGKVVRDHPFLSAIVALELVFLALPSLIVLVTSFSGGETLAFPPESLSVRWYAAIPGASDYIGAFANSIYAATLCTAIAVPAGVLTAIGLIRYDVRFKNLTQVYLLLPFTVPLVVSGVILFIIFGRLGWLDNIWAVGLALAIINLPFMLWSVTSSVNGIDPSIENAAKSLGAEELQTFVHVTFPQILPGVVTGALLMFILGLNEFIVSLFITSSGIYTLPVQLYTSIRGNVSPLIAAVSSVYVLVAMLAIVVADRVVGLQRLLHS
ncbi:ABC transporter permease [Halobacteriales archaeon QS_5_68_33]|nr:MAG: ABC transporter permease [Halobacteriales archaeon QS_5_68_33]